MNPLFLGSRERRLFGIYPAGVANSRPPRAALLCHAWGREYTIAYRSIRRLGDLLSRAGFHVLKCDYFGTGDSGGAGSATSLEGMEEDIVTALQELRDTSAVPRVTLVGLRLGAALAARVVARHPGDVRELVLWDPVDRGEDYLAELRRSPVPDAYRWRRIPAAAGPGSDLEIRGFAMSNDMIRSVGELDLGALVEHLPARTLVVASGHHPACATLEARLAEQGGERTFEVVESPCAWFEDDLLGAQAPPVALLERMVGWLGQSARSRSGPSCWGHDGRSSASIHRPPLPARRPARRW